MFKKENKEKQRFMRFATNNSVVEKIPSSINDAQSQLDDCTNKITKTISLISSLCCATPSTIATKGSNPLEYTNALFETYYKRYEEQIFTYCDLLLMCNEYYELEEKEQANYFKRFSRTISIDGVDIKNEQERDALYKECWNSVEELRTRLLGFSSATPVGVSPQDKEPIDYVIGEVRDTFDKIFELDLLMLKLVFLGQESIYHTSPECKETDIAKRCEWFWENCVETGNI